MCFSMHNFCVGGGEVLFVGGSAVCMGCSDVCMGGGVLILP